MVEALLLSKYVIPVLPSGFGKTIFYESFVILKDTSDPNQMPSIVVIVPCRIITKEQLLSNDQYLWVVAFEKKGNLLKDMASHKY